MAIDKYLDSGRVINDLTNAEKAHNLDNAGVIEKLRTAAQHCSGGAEVADAKATEFTNLADAYRLARGAYFTEIRRRLELQGDAFSTWHRKSGGTVGIGTSLRQAWRLMDAVAAPDPLAELQKQRAASSADSTVRRTIARVVGDAEKIGVAADPLYRIKSAWHELSSGQQEEFFRWARARLHATGRDPK